MRPGLPFFLLLAACAVFAPLRAIAQEEDDQVDAQVDSDVGISYSVASRPDRVVIRSNEVELKMVSNPGFTLTGQTSTTTIAGGTVAFQHELTNRSRRARRIRLDFENQVGDDFQLADLKLVEDGNANRKIDPTEQVLDDDGVITVQPGQKIVMTMHSRVPMDVKANYWAKVVIMAQDVDTGLVAVRVDMVDVAARPESAGLLVEKSVSRPTAAIGETVDYTLRVKNVTNYPLPDVRLGDALPKGFSLVKGTLRLDGVVQLDPILTASGIGLNLGEIGANASLEIKYRTRIGPLALKGDGVNRASASSIGFTSNTASVKVDVREEVFNSKGVVIGRVFVDTNGNGILDEGEKGVPGVRVYLEDGTYGIADVDGKYSFYGLSPRTHVLKLDTTSLPTGARLALISQSQAGSASSRFIDLARSELHKANFALVAAGPETLAEIDARRAALRPNGEIARELKGRLTADGLPNPIADTKALPSSGVVAPDDRSAPSAPFILDMSEKPSFKSPAPLATTLGTALPPPQDLATTPKSASEDAALAAIADNQLGFANLRDGAVLAAAQTDLMVKGPIGSSFEIAVNGTIIGKDRVGTKATVADRQAEVWTFVGVDLNPGANRLRVTLTDPFGNVRGSETLNVMAPGALAFVKLTAKDAIADGVTPAPVTVELVDAQDTPVTARTAITLGASLGQWQEEDLDPTQPGLQVFVEGGRHTFMLVPPIDPGECDLVVSSGVIKAEGTLTFQPNLRPMIATGVIEGTIHLGTRARGLLSAVDARDAFAEELSALSADSNNGKLAAGARAAFFLKGKVKGSYLLTAAFDSDKASRERLFRDIQPGEFYPVYGDSSVRGYDAQSTGKLYVRIDKGRSYALVGDFTTQPPLTGGADELRSLGNYQRSLTGVKEHYETDRVTANVWASQDTTRQFIGELPGNGTSGPYDFRIANAIANSERIEVLTRDRDQPSLVIATRPLIRFIDYEFEPFTGRLLLRAPIPSVDRDLNPVSLRITCEVDQGGKKFFVYGADAQVKVNQRLEVGAGYARDENPEDQNELMSVAARFKLTGHTVVTGEVAQSKGEVEGTGMAERVDLTHKDARTDVHAWLGRTDAEFRNPAALILPGRVEGGFKATHQLAPSIAIQAQGVLTEDVATGGRRQGVRVDVEKSFGKYKVAIGARHSDETDTPARAGAAATASNIVDSARVKFTAPVPYIAGAVGFLEYERDVRDGRKQLGAAGFDYAFKSGGRAYARHEFISALGGPSELNETQRNHTTVFGFERNYMQDGRIFNEYRASNEIYGREAEAAVGVRNTWKIAEGVRGNTSFERVTPIQGDNRNESTAVTGAIDIARSAIWRADGRLEVRVSPSTDSLLNTLGYARQIDSNFTFLSKSILLLTRVKGPEAGDLIQGRLQSGIAWRPKHLDRWNALGKYELKYESDSRAIADYSRRVTHLVSGDVNFQPAPGWSLSAHYAGKWVQETSTLGTDDYFAHLVAGRMAWEVGHRWGVALNAAALGDGSLTQFQFAVGPEVDLLIARNLNVGLGYNIVGFRDRDLAADGSSAQGVFFKVRLKFDEETLAALTPKEKS